MREVSHEINAYGTGQRVQSQFELVASTPNVQQEQPHNWVAKHYPQEQHEVIARPFEQVSFALSLKEG